MGKLFKVRNSRQEIEVEISCCRQSPRCITEKKDGIEVGFWCQSPGMGAVLTEIETIPKTLCPLPDAEMPCESAITQAQEDKPG
jgi:hypothetical protein